MANPRHRMDIHDQSGFTLIELIVVMIIIAVLLAISVPAYLGFKDRAQQKTAAGNVRSTIPTAEAYFVDKGTYAGMDVAALRAIDSGLSGTIRTVTVSPTDDYCISAKVGSWWAHVDGPGGSVVSAESADAC